MGTNQSVHTQNSSAAVTDKLCECSLKVVSQYWISVCEEVNISLMQCIGCMVTNVHTSAMESNFAVVTT